MSWIEYHTALRDHWKIKRLASVLECDYLMALGAISCLWLWAAEYAPNGDLRRFTDDEIRFAARMGHDKLTKKTLQGCGLLTEGQYINDWGQHGLKLLQSKRKANREYAQRKRKSGYPLDTQRIAIPTIPNHTIPTIPNQPNHIKTISPQIEDLLKQFPSTTQEKIKVYWERVKQKNKSKTITDGRRLTLITELFNTFTRCKNNDLFNVALEAAIGYDAPCIGYVNAVIKNKLTQKPR